MEGSFWQQNLGLLVTTAVSLAAIVVSVAQVWVAFITKSRELELERLRHRREEEARSEERERDWNFRSVEFVAQHQDLLFGTDPAVRKRIAKVMLATFPPAVTQALFQRLEATADEAEGEEWQEQTSAASRLLLVRIDGMYVSREEREYRILRFLEDGTVLSASISSPTPLDYDKIAEWLIPGGNHPEGLVPLKPTGNSAEFEVQGSRLRFSTVWNDGTVDYEGIVRGDKLHLNIHSNITGHRSTKTYEFISTS